MTHSGADMQEPIYCSKKEIGYLTVGQKITGSRLNDYHVSEANFDLTAKPPAQSWMDWLLELRFSVAGSPRLQTIWDVKEAQEIGDRLIIKQPVFCAAGMCVACAGTGKHQARTFKAEAKCPVCKGRGYVTNVWNEEEPSERRDG
jgi:hypothetical protein